MKNTVKKSFSQKIRDFLRQGTSPRRLAAGITLAIVLGIFPVIGFSTWMITLLAVRFHLNLALMITLAYVIWPVQIALIIPFLRLGEWLNQVPPFPLTVDNFLTAFTQSITGALEKFWDINLLLACGWLAVSIPLGILMYFSLVPILTKFNKIGEA